MPGFLGAGDEKILQRAVHTTVAFGLVAGVLMTGVGVALSPQILRWMDTPESVMRESVTYLQIYFAGSLGFVMYNVLVGISAGCGRQQTSFVLSDRIVCDQSGVGSVVYHRISYRSGRCGGCNRDLSDRECTPLFLAAAADKGKLWIENSKNSF